jgi:hypothetical protein
MIAYAPESVTDVTRSLYVANKVASRVVDEESVVDPTRCCQPTGRRMLWSESDQQGVHSSYMRWYDKLEEGGGQEWAMIMIL